MSLPTVLLRDSFKESSSDPFRPITIPGRAVQIATRVRVDARSITILGTEA